MAKTFDVDSAKKAGYTQAQVNQFMSQNNLTPKKTMSGFLGNIGKSGVKLVGDIGSAVLNPVDTAKSLYGLGSGIVQMAIPGEQGNEKLAKAVGQFYVNRYGSLDNAWNSFYSDPVGVAADVSTVLGLGAGATKLAGLGKLSKGLSTASKIVDPLNVVSKTKFIPSKLKPNIGGKLGNALLSESENILTRGMGNPKSLEKAKGVSPVTMNELFAKYKLYDRSPETFGEAAKTANKTGKSILESAPTSIDTRRIVKLFDDEISKFSQQAKTSTKAQLAMQELINRKQMFLDGIQNPNVSTPLMSDASKVYDIKSAFQGDLPPTSFGMPSGEIGKNLGVKKAYQTLLSGIEEQAPGIKNVGREQSALLKLQDIAKASESRGAARQNLNFSKLGSAGIGGLVAGVPGAVGGFVAERIANSPQFLGASSRGLEMAGRVLNTKTPVPNLVKQGLNAGYQSGKVGRMINVDQGKTYQEKPLQTTQLKQVKNVPYKPSIPQVKKQLLTAEIKYTPPKNVFKNKSGFGKQFKLKAMN